MFLPTYLQPLCCIFHLVLQLHILRSLIICYFSFLCFSNSSDLLEIKWTESLRSWSCFFLVMWFSWFDSARECSSFTSFSKLVGQFIITWTRSSDFRLSSSMSPGDVGFSKQDTSGLCSCCLSSSALDWSLKSLFLFLHQNIFEYPYWTSKQI